jgi:hypothetical protein
MALEWLKRVFRGEAEGGTPVATPPPGAASEREGDAERETSTNAQTEGAADQPWSGNS